MRDTCEVQITAHPEKSDWYVATYRSGFLGASYSVEFANSITGAVALYHFVEMLKTRNPEEPAVLILTNSSGLAR